MNWKIRNSSLAFQKLFAEILKSLRWDFKTSEEFFKSQRRLFSKLAKTF
jgi:hypothetical protein